MADVSGKGVPAALFMVIAKTLIKNRAQMGGKPAEVLQFVNEQLCEGNDAELFVTVSSRSWRFPPARASLRTPGMNIPRSAGQAGSSNWLFIVILLRWLR